jgi:ABC-type Mn2+/Zn2+ transport system permease subunit
MTTLIIHLLIFIVFFIIGLAGEFLILKLQTSTSLKYDSDFAKKARLGLAVGIILLGLFAMFYSYWNVLAIPIGALAIFVGESWYYQIIYEKQHKRDREYKNNIKEVENEIDNCF